MKPTHSRTALVLAASALVVQAQAQDVRKGLVSYWPLDSISGDGLTTPDIASGNHMTVNFLSAANLTTGRHGQAMSFDGFFTYLSYRAGAVDTGLPVSRSPEYTIMFWTKGLVAGTGATDDRVFSESYSQSNNPLVNVGTNNTGASNTVNIYVRDLGGAARVNHLQGSLEAYNDEWHHVAYVVANGTGTIYVDGVLDRAIPYNTAPFPVDITSIGAIVRGPEGADAVAAHYTGLIDEVGVWERALTAAEVAEVKENRVATPVPAFAPEIALQPVGNPDLRVGRPLVLNSRAVGTRPLSYQWFKGTEEVPGATGATLTIDAVTTADSGDYTVRVTNAGGSDTSEVATVQVNEAPPPDLKRDLVAYYPLDEVEGTRTPDYASGYDMNLVNLTAADVVPGKVGNAMRFENARQTMLTRVSPADFSQDLPINQHPAFTVAFWAQVDTVGNNLTDLRLFSEGNTLVGDPLFNIGTDNTAATASVDLFIRRAGWTTVNHIKTTAQPFDGTWHHIAFVQNPDGSRALFVDGVRDELAIPAKPEGVWNVNTTTIGGILRSSATHWVTGLIDEVALWKRELSDAEVALLVSGGMPEIPRFQEPLAVRSFAADFNRVTAGDKVVLSWDVARFSTVSITPGPGDVTGQTVFGVGSTEVTVNADTTYTLTVSRDNESLTATTQVKVLNGVATGWRLLENFEGLNPGPVGGQPNWKNPDGVASVVQLDGNRALGYDGGQDLAALDLRSKALLLGQNATLFFRAYVTPASTEAIGINVGLTDKPIRFVGDFAQDVGPYTRIERLDVGMDINILARYGFGGAYDVGTGADFTPYVLQPDRVYNVWIDVQNNDINAGGDTYAVHIQGAGEAQRTTVFTGYIEDRNPAGSADLGLPQPNLTSVLAAAVGANQGVNTVFVDDFFLSQTGSFLSTVPVAPGSFDPAPVDPPKGAVVWVSFHAADETPSGAAATAGFTEAPDVGYTRLLEDNGWTVSRVVTSAAPDPALFQDAKVVIISRSVPSGHYQNAGAVAWNGIGKPIIVMGGYTIRNSRMGFTTGGTIPDTAGTIRLAVDDPTHPIFDGVTIDGGNVTANAFAGIATFNSTPQRGISVNTDPLAGGTRLASVSLEGDPANGGMIIGEWPAGSVMANADASVLAGPRLVFLSGSREASGLTSEGSGIYDLTEDGARMFLNAVAYMAGGGPVSQAIGVTRNADGSITLTYDGVLTAADTLGGAYAPVDGATSPYTVSPAGAARFFKLQ